MYLHIIYQQEHFLFFGTWWQTRILLTLYLTQIINIIFPESTLNLSQKFYIITDTIFKMDVFVSIINMRINETNIPLSLLWNIKADSDKQPSTSLKTLSHFRL